jgi:hypothetical protein
VFLEDDAAKLQGGVLEIFSTFANLRKIHCKVVLLEKIHITAQYLDLLLKLCPHIKTLCIKTNCIVYEDAKERLQKLTSLGFEVVPSMILIDKYMSDPKTGPREVKF